MKLLLCAFVTLFSVAFAFPTPGKDVPQQCADPTFACQDLQSARLCRTVSACINDVWASMNVPDDNDEICDICKEMVKEARDQLLSNMTQEEIKEVFEGSCKLLPIKIVANACIKVVDEIIPELVEMLASRMDPTMVCTVSGMCFASKDPNSLESHVLKYVKSFLIKSKQTQCDECTKMIVDVQVFLNSTDEADVKKYLEDFCGEKIPKYLCDIVMNTYFNEIYTMIKTNNAETLCASVGICPKKLEESQFVQDDLTCEFCEHLLQHVKDLITTNTTLEEFKTALLNFCKQTGKYADKCTSLVNDYYDMLFNYIKQLNTKGMCTLMGLCSNTRRTLVPLVRLDPPVEMRKQQRTPQIKLIPAQRVRSHLTPLVRLVPAAIISKKEMRESNDIFPQVPLGHPLIFQNDVECSLCKAFSFYLEKDLNGDQSKVGVRQTLDGLCEKWMSEYSEFCHRIVTKNSLKIQIAVEKGANFSDLCQLLKVCPLEKKESGVLGVRVIHKLQDKPFCDLCKDAMGEVEKELSDPAMKQKLESALNQVCNYLPQSWRDDCTSFINQNVDSLIDTLEQELKPDNICPAFGLCSASQQAPRNERIKDLECDVCKDVVTSFRKKLQDPGSKVIVQTFLEEGCARLPASVSAECKKFVDENIDTVMTIIITELDPDQVCAILKICPASLRAVEKPQNIKNIECEACKALIGELEKLAEDKSTQDEIKKGLEKICSILPSSLAAKCTSLVDQYTDLLITFIVEELDADQLCSYIKLCPASLKQVKNIQMPKVKDVECDLCKEVVGKVEDLVKDKKTEAEIKSALDKVCSYLPQSIAAKCTNFVNTYTETIITLLMTELDPEMVCAEMSLCPDQILVHLREWMQRAEDFECQTCYYSLHFLQEFLMNPQEETQLKNAIKKVCDSVLPTSLSNNCKAYVDEYGSAFLVVLAQALDPSTMCAQWNFCPHKNMSAFLPDLPTTPTALVNFSADQCSICTTVVDYVDKLLELDDVDLEITHVIEKVCVVVPASYKEKCTTMLEAYGPYILQMIGQMADSKQLCQEIDLCSRPSGHVHLIGGSKCTFGPSYWCSSATHAAACKAEEFCETKVWMTKTDLVVN